MKLAFRLPNLSRAAWVLLTAMSLQFGLAPTAAAQTSPGAASSLRIGLSAEVTTLDPHWLNVAPNIAAHWNVFEALVRNDRDARIEPLLAQSWKVIDTTTWEFKLKPNVRFHDGSEFTADDVVFSLARPDTLIGSPGPFTSFTKPIASVTAVDKLTVRIKTKEPNYAALLTDLNSVFIVSRKHATGATQADFDAGKAAIGTGPYRFAKFAKGDRLEFERFAEYHAQQPDFERVTLRILPQDSARVAALLAGDVDAIENPPTQDLARIRKETALHIEQQVSWRTLFFHLDQGRDVSPFITGKDGKPLAANPLKDVRVREAISKAINREALVERVMEKLALPASNVVSPPIFGHNAALKPVGYDIEGAKKLLAAAGYPAGFNVTLHGTANRYVNDERVVQAVAAMLGRIGITAKVETQPVATYFGKMRNGEFSIALLGWGSQGGDLALRSLLGTPNPQTGFGTWNWGKYSNPKLDTLIAQALTTTDQTQREAIAREGMGLAMNDFAVIPLHHQVAIWAMRKGITFAARTDEFTYAFQFKRVR